MSSTYLGIRNLECVEIKNVPELTMTEFQETILSKLDSGERITSLFGFPIGQPSEEQIKIVGVLADGSNGTLSLLSTICKHDYPSLTPRCPQAELFEREIYEQWGLKPEGHPWLKPVRFHSPYRQQFGSPVDSSIPNPIPGVMDYYRVGGEEVHEVAVGPVHAGIIEPGHFRFQCSGEEVLNLEISLGYQHRGIERNLIKGPGKRIVPYMETLAGDTSIGHTTAFSHLVESLSASEPPARGEVIRAVALELERLANHTGDLGAMAGDIGYLPTASYCGRLRGDFLNMTAALCGNRFGRGLVRPGGVLFDLTDRERDRLLEFLDKTLLDLTDAVALLWGTPSVLARFEGTGGIPLSMCEELGVVGPAARACGLERDARFEFPSGYFRFSHIPVSTWHTGDVFSRAYLRWLEIQRSGAFVRERLEKLPDGPVRSKVNSSAPDRIVASLVEGWRGEICHVALTNDQGRFSHYKIVDPSFHNWKALSMALRGGQISDFPLINKSFNLSYSGHDL